jgi:oligopeptidase B
LGSVVRATATAALALFAASSKPMEPPMPLVDPPIAVRKAYTQIHHGVTLDDPYHWLRDPAYPALENPEILAYLAAENAFFEAQMAPHRPLIDTLYAELKARQQPHEAAVPWRDGAYEYQWRFDGPEAEYRVWSRWPVGDPQRAQVIVDEPALAAGHEYFQLGTLEVSPSGRYLVYGTDTEGAERYALVIKDLARDRLLPETITGAGGDVAWANDDATFYYTLLSPNWRPYVVKAHRLGTPVADDRVVYEEQGGLFVSVGTTQSRAYVLITAGDHVTSEVRFFPADEPSARPRLIAARRDRHEYDVEHHGDYFYIRTNDRHRNFRLVRAPIADPAERNWQSVIEGRDDDYLTGLTCFRDFLVLEERINGLDRIRIRDYAGHEYRIAFPEPAYDVGIGTNAEFAIDILRLDYESMITPQTVFDYHVADRRLETRKVRTVPSGYDAGQYRTERLMVNARDGMQIPVSIVYRAGFRRDGRAPLLLYGYGAYGIAMTPEFSTARLSLLDRGYAYAIAHVRGGDDMGYHWYEDGKLAKRTNTFNDFIDVARGLIERQYTAAGRIAIMGGSAGGTLIGAVVNDAPELWGAAVAQVPFVDVLNTILDADLPLTRLEWPEWGNPIDDQAVFEFIRSWSPYDQIGHHRYPPMLVTAGLNDPRVTYWEAAKYVAKLRHEKTDANPLLLKVNMGAGHGGKSGRYEYLHEVAEEFAFVITTLGGE